MSVNGSDEPWVIPDADLRYLVLGALRMMPMMESFPLMVREIVDNLDSNGVVQSFTIVTGSGLRYTVRVDFDGQT
jgi:hypothetical protein